MKNNIVSESHTCIHVQMKQCINELNISYRPTILLLTARIGNNGWSYSKQTK